MKLSQNLDTRPKRLYRPSFQKRQRTTTKEREEESEPLFFKVQRIQKNKKEKSFKFRPFNKDGLFASILDHMVLASVQQLNGWLQFALPLAFFAFSPPSLRLL
jgi:hypothetical protein